MSTHASLMAWSVLTLFGLFTPPLWAQDDESSDDQSESKSDEESRSRKQAKAKAKADSDESVPPDSSSSSPLAEEPDVTYYFVGARYRAIIVPKFMMNMFGADGGRTVVVHSGGPEFAIRENGFEYNFSLWFAGYSMADTPFKAAGDPNRSWEIVNSQLSVLYLTTDFVWSHEFSPSFALNYGLGAGIGFVWGDLFRTQAFPPEGVSTNNPDGYKKCKESGDPRDTRGGYCGDDNSHYHSYSEPSWANGGSKPIIFPWLVFQTGVRYKIHQRVVARLDLGFGTSGFFAGLGLDYGI